MYENDNHSQMSQHILAVPREMEKKGLQIILPLLWAWPEVQLYKMKLFG